MLEDPGVDEDNVGIGDGYVIGVDFRGEELDVGEPSVLFITPDVGSAEADDLMISADGRGIQVSIDLGIGFVGGIVDRGHLDGFELVQEFLFLPGEGPDLLFQACVLFLKDARLFVGVADGLFQLQCFLLGGVQALGVFLLHLLQLLVKCRMGIIRFVLFIIVCFVYDTIHFPGVYAGHDAVGSAELQGFDVAAQCGGRLFVVAHSFEQGHPLQSDNDLVMGHDVGVLGDYLPQADVSRRGCAQVVGFPQTFLVDLLGQRPVFEGIQLQDGAVFGIVRFDELLHRFTGEFVQNQNVGHYFGDAVESI